MHYESSEQISASPDELFAYIDDHTRLSSHMNKSSWMMGGSRMDTHIDEGKGQKVGSHIRMSGKILGVSVFLDEVITRRDPPWRKTWETVGDINLIVIGHYRMGFKIESRSDNSNLKVYIDYELPKSPATRLFGFLLGGMYAKWCVKQMITGARDHFITKA